MYFCEKSSSLIMGIYQTKYDSSNDTKFIILMNPEAIWFLFWGVALFVIMRRAEIIDVCQNNAH